MIRWIFHVLHILREKCIFILYLLLLRIWDLISCVGKRRRIMRWFCHRVFLRLPSWIRLLLPDIHYLLFSFLRVKIRITIYFIWVNQSSPIISSSSWDPSLILLLGIKRWIYRLNHFWLWIDLPICDVILACNSIVAVRVVWLIILIIFSLYLFFAHGVNWSRQPISSSVDLLIAWIDRGDLAWVKRYVLIELWHFFNVSKSRWWSISRQFTIDNPCLERS